jgi:hypothetical protein
MAEIELEKGGKFEGEQVPAPRRHAPSGRRNYPLLTSHSSLVTHFVLVSP